MRSSPVTVDAGASATGAYRAASALGTMSTHICSCPRGVALVGAKSERASSGLSGPRWRMRQSSMPRSRHSWLNQRSSRSMTVSPMNASFESMLRSYTPTRSSVAPGMSTGK